LHQSQDYLLKLIDESRYQPVVEERLIFYDTSGVPRGMPRPW